MMPINSSSPTFIPVKSLEGISVVDSNLNHVVSLASLSDKPLSNSQQAGLEAVLNFPGLSNAFQYYFENNSVEGVPSSLFGPIVIQLQPADKVAALLYLERSMGRGVLFTIVLKEFHLHNGLPSFSESNIDCIHFANKDQIRSYFNRVHPMVCLTSTLVSLANAIYLINHEHDSGVVRFLEERTQRVLEEREKSVDSPGGLMLAPYGRTEDGKFFSVEPEDEEETLNGVWKDDYNDLMANFYVYSPSLLEHISKRESKKGDYYVNDSIGPLRLKYIDESTAEGLFLLIRSNSSRGYEFWRGRVPYQGDRMAPQIDYSRIVPKKRRMTSIDILDVFPTIDALDILLPTFLQASETLHKDRTPQKSIQVIIGECKKTHPRETRFALQELATKHQCEIETLLEHCPHEEIQVALYQSIQLGKESKRVLKEMEPYRRLGSTDDLLFPGSQEEFKQIQKERLRAVREAEYKQRVKTVNQKTPLFHRG